MIASRTVDSRIRKCLFLAEILFNVAVIMAAVLSICVLIADELTLKIFSYRGRIQRAAIASDVRAAYSASHVLCAVIVCFFDHHATGESLMKKMPEVPFEELILPQLPSEDAVGSMLPCFGKNRDADFVCET